MADDQKPFSVPEIDLTSDGRRMPEVVVYQDADFKGWDYRTNLNVVYFAQDSVYNDNISSIIVVSGVWEFFVDSYFKGQKSTLGPGYYPNPESTGLPNDSISSMRCISL